MYEPREHPIANAIVVGVTLAGVASAPWWAPAEWSLPRQLLVGLLAGAGVGLLFVFTHVIGAYDDFAADD